MLRTVRILLLAASFALPTSVHASYVWSFTNSGLTYGPTDTIFLNASITNTGTESIYIDVNLGTFGQGITWGTFPSGAFPGPGDYVFWHTAYDTLEYATILPGESRDFVFGRFTPVSSVASGTYATLSADISINGGPNVSELNGGHFVATVVPVPAAAWFFGSGLVMLFGLTRKKTTNRQVSQ